MPAALSEEMKNRPAIAGLFFCCLCSVLRSFKCLLQIGDDVVGVFQTDCQTNQTIREAGGLNLFFRAHGVRHRSGVLDKRLAVAEADGQRAQMHVVEHFFGFLKAAHLEGDNTAEPRHLADSHGMSQAIRASKHLSLPYPEQAGGVFFWVQIPDTVDAVLLWKRLRLQGVKLMPGTVFSLTGSAQHFLRLSYVGCPLELIPKGIHCIDREIDWLLEHQAASEI